MTETLKGGVSYNNYKYVWHTEGKNICAVCASMEGEEYASEEDIPDRPHPNCKCYVDIEEIGEGSGSATTDRPDNDEEDSENRDPEEPKEPEKPRKKTNRLDELIGDFMSLQDEAYALESEIDSITEKDNEASKIIATFSQNYITEIRKLNYTIQSHVSVLESMKDDEEEPSNSVIELYENYYYTCESHLQTLISCFEKELDRIKNKEKLKNDFQKDYKKHSELKDLNQYVYHRERQDLLHGYKLVAEVHQQDSGFDGYVFEKGKEAVVLYEGSNDRKDYIYDVTDIRSHKNPQLEDAEQLYEKVKNNPDYDNIIITGYSLGGNSANQVGTVNNEYTVIFNPYYGIDGQLQNAANDSGEVIETHPEKVVIYRTDGDELGNVNKEGHNADTIYKVEHEEKFGYVVKHKTENTESPSKETVEPEIIENRNQQTVIFPTLESYPQPK